LLFNAKWAIFHQLYHGEKLPRTIYIQWYDGDVYFFNRPTSIVLVHWNNSPLGRRVCRSTRTHYPDSEPNQSLPLLLKAACLAESSKCQLYSLWFDPTGALEARILTITNTDAVSFICTFCIRRKYTSIKNCQTWSTFTKEDTFVT